ncbi:hypothetical protein QBC34DRAFT_413325 [Podospora aff. communis PSN243]|uniref:HMG box domain-containing protein n=1 Tax=Podospora aff. communis PSN243 TaxID=3040156 RepID=A0AAV9GBK2_9PEZI|nr:hypothetical protein QBC34DRAFT_413325 [Podospora aff. communis PSN243]
MPSTRMTTRLQATLEADRPKARNHRNLKPSPIIEKPSPVIKTRKYHSSLVKVDPNDWPKVLPKPLSELIPKAANLKCLSDVEAFATRSVEVRKGEILTGIRQGSKNQSRWGAGKIPRPLNAFLLYRKTYDHQVRVLIAQRNLSISGINVSSISGRSWKMEGKALLDKFASLAATERRLHYEAFPDYVFHPRRPKAILAEEIAAMEQDTDMEDAGDEYPVPAYAATASSGFSPLPQLPMTPDFGFEPAGPSTGAQPSFPAGKKSDAALVSFIETQLQDCNAELAALEQRQSWLVTSLQVARQGLFNADQIGTDPFKHLRPLADPQVAFAANPVEPSYEEMQVDEMQVNHEDDYPLGPLDDFNPMPVDDSGDRSISNSSDRDASFEIDPAFETQDLLDQWLAENGIPEW